VVKTFEPTTEPAAPAPAAEPQGKDHDDDVTLF
jgi:hypothetical protein